MPSQPNIWQNNKQFEPLLTDLWNIIASCLTKNPEERPTAVQLTEECNKLGYIYGPRESGIVETYPILNRKCGFIHGDNHETVFFHRLSFFGESGPDVGMKVAYSKYPGTPHPRAFPVVSLD